MSAEKHSRIKPLSVEEEQCIRAFYENKLQEVCNNFHFPHKIQVCKLFSGYCKCNCEAVFVDKIIMATLFFL